MTRINNHVVFTKDESVWFHFSGDVPRVGDKVRDLNTGDSGDDQTFIVKSVLWFMEAQQNQELIGNDDIRMCSARVLVEPSNWQS